MKKGNHQFVTTKVTCSCGNTFEVRSNKEELHLEVCDKCHPFYTGHKLRASKKGNIEKFNEKYNLSSK